MFNINITERNKQVIIKANIKDSLHASLLADRIDKLSYLKVSERKYYNQSVTVIAHIIPSIFSIEKLHNDLYTMSDLIIQENE